MSVKPLVIFDLDGTLIWSIFLPDDLTLKQADFTIQVYGNIFAVRKRPGLDNFLMWCRQHFRLAVWTAAKPAYAYAIVETIFKGIQLEFVFTSQHVTQSLRSEVIIRKSLLRVWAIPFQWFNHRNTRIIDDTPETYEFNKENAIPITTWTDDTSDTELLRVQQNLTDWLQGLDDSHWLFKFR